MFYSVESFRFNDSLMKIYPFQFRHELRSRLKLNSSGNCLNRIFFFAGQRSNSYSKVISIARLCSRNQKQNAIQFQKTSTEQDSSVEFCTRLPQNLFLNWKIFQNNLMKISLIDEVFFHILHYQSWSLSLHELARIFHEYENRTLINAFFKVVPFYIYMVSGWLKLAEILRLIDKAKVLSIK